MLLKIVVELTLVYPKEAFIAQLATNLKEAMSRDQSCQTNPLAGEKDSPKPAKNQCQHGGLIYSQRRI